MTTSLFDFNAWIEKALATYMRAVSARNFEDLDNQGSAVYRCRSLLIGSVLLSVVSLTFLLFSMNLNALNLARRPPRGDGVTETTIDFMQNVATAFQAPTLHNLNFSRQFSVLAVTILGSIFSAALVSLLMSLKTVPNVGRMRRLAFYSLTVSLGLVHFSIACAFGATFVLLARFYGCAISGHWLTTSIVIVSALLSVPLLTYCVRRWCEAGGSSVTVTASSSAWYSAIAPILVTYILMLNAGWVNEKFNPSIMAMLSDSCGAPDKAACVLTFKPRHIDGMVALDGVRINLILEYMDESDIVGPRYRIQTSGSLRVIQNPDTPLPLQISTDIAVGVIGHIDFDCPMRLTGSPRKLVVNSYVASAATRILDGSDYGRVEMVPVRFAYNAELSRLFRNSANGCQFFP
ncbi:hypothetical protein AAB988_22420 [Burkholderia contaminans]|uniref:hypothetical protein n=1 Tax=Burkholderia contaminans TaxID=488447 RepID=UPI003116A213